MKLDARQNSYVQRSRQSRQNRLRQRGVTLIIGMIMLVLITVMVISAYSLSSTNFKAVGNMQFRNESIAAANKAIEQVIGTNFATGFITVPDQQSITYDNNNDTSPDYTVTVDKPECVQASVTSGGLGTGQFSSVDLEGFNVGTNYTALFDIKATVTDAVSGTAVVVRQGVRTQITSVQRDAVCPA